MKTELFISGYDGFDQVKYLSNIENNALEQISKNKI